MRSALSKPLWLWIPLALWAQSQPGGLTPEWDIQKTLEAIAAHAGRLQPILDQLDPQTWVGKGASDTYVTQWNAARTQAKAVAAAARELSKRPDKLTGALETFFRVQSLELVVGSLQEGIRKYQNPALADLLSGTVAENGANREKLQRYILDLAAQKEQEFQVADREAQRCREFLSKNPPAKKADKKAERK